MAAAGQDGSFSQPGSSSSTVLPPCQRKCYGLLHLSAPASSSSPPAAAATGKAAPVPTCYGVSVSDNNANLAFQEHNLLRDLPRDSTVESFLCVGKATYFTSYEKHPAAAKLGMTADREYPPVCEGVEFLHYVLNTASTVNAVNATSGAGFSASSLAAMASVSSTGQGGTTVSMSAGLASPTSPITGQDASSTATPAPSSTTQLSAAQAVAAASSFAAPFDAVMVVASDTATSTTLPASAAAAGQPTAASEQQAVGASQAAAAISATASTTARLPVITMFKEPTTAAANMITEAGTPGASQRRDQQLETTTTADDMITEAGMPVASQCRDQQLEPAPFSVSGQYPSWLLPKPGPVTSSLQRAGRNAADFAAARKEDAVWVKERTAQAVAEADPLWLARGFGEHAGSTWQGMVGLWGSLRTTADELHHLWQQRSGK